MPTFTAKVSKDGSVVIPDELRKLLDIEPGSEVEFFLTIDGQVHFHHLTDRFSDFGLRIGKPPISIREMDDAIAEAVGERYERSLSSGRSRKPAAE
jgi:AbrB family looped-hinge helix DNA binding protein